MVLPTMPPVIVRLRRIAMLDTVKVRATKQGLFGVVASASDLHPLPNAQLKIMGISAEEFPKLPDTGDDKTFSFEQADLATMLAR